MLAETEPIIHAGFSPGAVLASGADHVSLVPTQLRRLLHLRGSVASSARSCSAAPRPRPELLAAARAAGARVVTTYGMSETCGGCVYDGGPFDSVDFDVGDDGRIRVSGPVLFHGYRLRPDLTGGRPRRRLVPHLRPRRPGRRRLRVLGRADDVINTGGEKVVAARPWRPCVADTPRSSTRRGRPPDPEWGERVVAVVVSPTAAPRLAELRDFCQGTATRATPPPQNWSSCPKYRFCPMANQISQPCE